MDRNFITFNKTNQAILLKNKISNFAPNPLLQIVNFLNKNTRSYDYKTIKHIFFKKKRIFLKLNLIIYDFLSIFFH